MADFVKGFFGGASSSAAPVVSADADFADFAASPTPSPADFTASPSASATAKPWFSWGPPEGRVHPLANRPYTKWYNIHERVSLSDFYMELFILPFLALVILVHVWGTRTNRFKAKKWMGAHVSALQNEFAVVGFGGKRAPSSDEVQAQGLAKASAAQMEVDELVLKEKSKDVFVSYATGRQNVAFVDVKLSLLKRYNPLALFGDSVLGFFFESMPAPTEKAEIVAYAFDGKEAQLVQKTGEQPKKGKDSTFDGFVWAVVHKDMMKKLRDERYDLSLTTTKDNAKLPPWATVMSESAEITDTLLTPELIKAVEACGENLEALIVTDMPEDAPKKLDDLVPKKRLSLTVRLNSTPSSQALFSYFLRMPDQLVSSAHFRPEVMRRVRTTREQETQKIKKLDEEEKAEERRLLGDKLKKEERDRKLKGMTAEEQRKFLEKERVLSQKRNQSRKTMRA